MPTIDLDPAWTSNTGTQSTTSAAFSPAAGSLIVIDAIADSGASGITASITDSVGLTWTAVGTVQDGGAGGAAMSWWAYTAASQTGMTVTVTWAGTGTSLTKAVKPTTWTGTATTSAVVTKAQAASATNNLTVNVTTTNTGCRISGAAIDWNALGLPTSTDDEVGFHSASNISGVAVHKSADSGASGSSVGLNFDAFGAAAADWGYKVYEIVPAAGGGTVIPRQPVVAPSAAVMHAATY